MTETIILPGYISNDLVGYSSLTEIANRVVHFNNMDITIDMSYTTWFSANLCSLLGAILSDLSYKNNRITFKPSVNDKVRRIIEENGFGQHYFNMNTPLKSSAISFKKFNTTDVERIKIYIENDLLNRWELPVMSDLAKKNILKTIFEVFENARMHSGSSTVFACGQCYPLKEKVDFTIVDFGVTIKENVFSFLNSNKLSLPHTAIEWAMMEENTTKNDTSGGLGFTLLQDFIRQNNGKLQIYSDNEFWELSNGKINKQITAHTLKGTLVNLEINMNDTERYVMSDEVNCHTSIF